MSGAHFMDGVDEVVLEAANTRQVLDGGKWVFNTEGNVAHNADTKQALVQKRNRVQLCDLNDNGVARISCIFEGKTDWDAYVAIAEFAVGKLQVTKQ